jgi:hypothetical protein
MLYDALADTEEPSAAELRTAYAEELADTVEAAGFDAAVETTGLDADLLSTFADGEVGDATLADAAAVLGLDDGPDADTVETEVRDHVLMEMSTAILDVDTVAVEIDSDLTAKEVQSALEGRIRLTLAELADVHALIERRKR